MTGLGRMDKHVMAALHAAQCPAIRLELLDNLLAVHGGYYNHQFNKGNAKENPPV